MKKILLISPHTDDELFGAGGTLLQLKKRGCSILLAVMSCTNRYLHHLNREITLEEQWSEFCKCANEISTEVPIRYDTGNLRLEEVPEYKGIRWLDGVIRNYEPDIVLIPEPSYHQEHKITYNICIASVRPTYARKQIDKIIAYEIPTSTWNGIDNGFKPNIYNCIDSTVTQKIEIFKECYKLQYTETARVKLGEEGIKAHSVYRGCEAGCNNAEAFMIIKGLSYNGDIVL